MKIAKTLKFIHSNCSNCNRNQFLYTIDFSCFVFKSFDNVQSCYKLYNGGILNEQSNNYLHSKCDKEDENNVFKYFEEFYSLITTKSLIFNNNLKLLYVIDNKRNLSRIFEELNKSHNGSEFEQLKKLVDIFNKNNIFYKFNFKFIAKKHKGQRVFLLFKEQEKIFYPLYIDWRHATCWASEDSNAKIKSKVKKIIEKEKTMNFVSWDFSNKLNFEENEIIIHLKN